MQQIQVQLAASWSLIWKIHTRFLGLEFSLVNVSCQGHWEINQQVRMLSIFLSEKQYIFLNLLIFRMSFKNVFELGTKFQYVRDKLENEVVVNYPIIFYLSSLQLGTVVRSTFCSSL